MHHELPTDRKVDVYFALMLLTPFRVCHLQDDEMADWSRWSCAPKLGGACSISYTFGMALDLSELRLGERPVPPPFLTED